MKCLICQYGETETGTTTVSLTRGETTIVFRDVPAQVCTICAEKAGLYPGYPSMASGS
jgi:YgiT-type zinc finger domain-containing protein